MSEGFSFIQVTDHHLHGSEARLTCGYSPAHAFRMLMRHIAGNAAHRADFIVTTGDITETPSPDSYRTVRRMLGLEDGTPEVDAPGPHLVSIEGLNRFPMYFLPGNHDDRRNFFNCLSLRTPPAALMNVKFRHKGVQFVCVDWGPTNRAVSTSEMFAFLEEALRENIPSILLMHHPVVPIGVGWIDDFLAADLGRFWEVVRGRAVLGIFCGHLHATYETNVQGIPVCGLRSTAPQFVLQDEPLLCIQPLHYRLVHVQPGSLTTEIVEVEL